MMNLMRPLQDHAHTLQQHLYNYVEDEAWILEFNDYFQLFSDVRDKYQTDGFFINPNEVIARMDVDRDHPTALTASATVSMANIASLLADIHTTEHQSGFEASRLLPYIQAWDDAFPSKFLPQRQPNHPQWAEESEVIDLAIRLRIQRTISTLEEGSGDMELISLIDAIWIDPKGLSPRHDLLTFLSSNKDEGVIGLKKPVADISLNDERYTELRNRYIDVVRQLYATASGGQLAAAVAQLKKEHPIEPLMKQLRRWCFSLFAEIHKTVDPTRANTVPQSTPSVMASQIDSQVESQVDPRMYAPPEARPAA